MKFTRFARQFDPESGILQLMHDLGGTDASPAPVAMLGGGNPAAIPAMESAFRQEMEHLLGEGRGFESALGAYDAPGGDQAFRQAVADLLSGELQQPVSRRNIAVTNGSQSGFAVLFNLFGGYAEDGMFRRIVLPLAPEYIGYSDVGLGDESLMQSSRPIIELHGENGFKYRVDFAGLALGDDSGAICLSRPTNPTGNVVTDDELSHLRELASSRDIPLILDCAYGQPFPGIVFGESTPCWDENMILCLSLSKLGLPGVRTGIIVASEAVIELITSANAVFSLAPGSFGPGLSRRMIVNREIIRLSREIIQPWYRERSRLATEIALELMGDLPLRIHDSEGAIFLWFWFEGLPITSDVLYKRLKARGVYVISGHHFFPGLRDDWRHRHECIRVSYAAPEDELRRGLEIISDEVRQAFRDGREAASG